jgi:hypothetical protein
VYPPHVLAQRSAVSTGGGGHGKQLHDVEPAAFARNSAAHSYSTALDATTPIQSTSTHYPSPAAGGRPVQQPQHHTPLHYRGGGGVLNDAPSHGSSTVSQRGGGAGASARSSSFQLGVDVADGPEGHGARIMVVLDGSAAQRCGLRTSETVMQVNGQQVSNANHFASLMRSETEAALHNAHQRRAMISLMVAQDYVIGGRNSTRIVDIPLD